MRMEILIWLLCLLVRGLLAHHHHHDSNWALLVCTSRDWLNYRHVANTLSLYRTVKRLGISDRNIILMLADDMACNARNGFPGTVYNTGKRLVDLYGDRVETDYRGYDVTVRNFIQVLTGHHEETVPRSKRMLSNEKSNILIYLTGHGGDEFLKFQGIEELMAKDLADAIEQMHEKGRYYQIFLMIDTCEAQTMYSRIHSPNVYAISSSLKGESSYSAQSDPSLGISLVDRFTSATLDFFEKINIQSNATIADLLSSYRSHELLSTVNNNEIMQERNSVSILDFFGHARNAYPILTKRQHMRSRKREALNAFIFPFNTTRELDVHHKKEHPKNSASNLVIMGQSFASVSWKLLILFCILIMIVIEKLILI